MTHATMRRGFYSRAEWALMSEPAIGVRTATGVEQLITQTGAIQNYAVGSRIEAGLSVYRYGLAGAAILALGVLCQAPVPTAGEHDLSPNANHAAGVFVVTVTTGAAVGLNEYAGGWMHVNDGTGQGQVYRILSHPANAGAALCAFTLIDPVTTGLETANTLCALTANPYTATIITVAPPTAQLIGVPVVSVAATEYGWFQTRGPAAVLTQGTLYVHQQVRPSATVVGAVAHAIQQFRTGSTGAAAHGAGPFFEDSQAAAIAPRLADGVGGATYDTGSLQVIVGKVIRVEVNGDYSLIDLTLE